MKMKKYVPSLQDWFLREGIEMGGFDMDGKGGGFDSMKGGKKGSRSENIDKELDSLDLDLDFNMDGFGDSEEDDEDDKKDSLDD